MSNVPEIIVIHHSATKDGQVNDFNAIKNYHVNKGWADIGYHWLIEYENGKVVTKQGRDEKTIGAHTLGYNEKSIGICVVGNFDVTVPTNEEIAVLINLIKDIYKRYGRLPIKFHNEFANKSCPGKNFPKKEKLQAEVDGVKTLNIFLRKGLKSDLVDDLQVLLNRKGYGLSVDNDFGLKTYMAVKDFQAKNGLVADGIVGNLTWSVLTKGGGK